MKQQMRQNGFSLTEALIATGILAMGLVMIAMAFPVGVKLASISTERPVGVIAADEAFAKMRLYGFNETGWPANANSTCTDYWQISATPPVGIDDQRCYPSLVPQPDDERRYYWSALVRRINANTGEIQATVFVCRMLGMGSTYYDMDAAPNDDNRWPVPVRVEAQTTFNPKEIVIPIPSPLVYTPSGVERRFFSEGCFVVEDSKGTIYRVTELIDRDGDAAGIKETLVLDKVFSPSAAVSSYYVWVVPPAMGSNRNPCIHVAQKPLTIK